MISTSCFSMLVFLFILSLFSQEDEEDCHAVNLHCSASWQHFFTPICHSTRERGVRKIGGRKRKIVRQKKRARRARAQRDEEGRWKQKTEWGDGKVGEKWKMTRGNEERSVRTDMRTDRRHMAANSVTASQPQACVHIRALLVINHTFHPVKTVSGCSVTGRQRQNKPVWGISLCSHLDLFCAALLLLQSPAPLSTPVKHPEWLLYEV